jgi:hypothetical protein
VHCRYMREGDLFVIIEEDYRISNASLDAIETEIITPIIKPANASLLLLGVWPNNPDTSDPEQVGCP